MITSIKELHTTIERSDGEFFNYLICKVRAGYRARYNLYRIGNRNRSRNYHNDACTRLGCELSLGYCRRMIRAEEPNGTVVVVHKAGCTRKSRVSKK